MAQMFINVALGDNEELFGEVKALREKVEATGLGVVDQYDFYPSLSNRDVASGRMLWNLEEGDIVLKKKDNSWLSQEFKGGCLSEERLFSI